MHRPSVPAPRISATTSAAAVVVAALIAAVGVPATAVAAAPPPPPVAALTSIATVATAPSHAGALTDAELDGLVALLESLPSDLQIADPRTTPDYEQRLGHALDRVAEEQHLTPASRQATVRTALLSDTARTEGTASIGTSTSRPTTSLAVDWWTCAAAIAGVIAQYAIPVFKVVRWIREAQEIWGTAYGVYVAIRDGVFAVQMGEEAAQLLGALLGMDGVTRACFNSSSLAA
jgi:hypothetical protein